MSWWWILWFPLIGTPSRRRDLYGFRGRLPVEDFVKI